MIGIALMGGVTGYVVASGGTGDDDTEPCIKLNNWTMDLEKGGGC